MPSDVLALRTAIPASRSELFERVSKKGPFHEVAAVDFPSGQELCLELDRKRVVNCLSESIMPLP
jgi:hypothetical protein